MKKLRLLIAPVLVGLCLGLQHSDADKADFEKARVESTPGRRVCYYQSWASYNVSDIPWDLCTHVIYSFAGLNQSTYKLDTKHEESQYRDFIRSRGKHSNVKAMLAVGGQNEAPSKFTKMAYNKERRSVFINSVIKTLKDYDFDGLDMDWEYPGVTKKEDKENFRLLMKELREALDAKGMNWELTMAVSINNSTVEGGYAVPSLCKSVHAVHLMTYDIHGSWDNKTDSHTLMKPHQSEGFSVTTGVKVWEESGCARNKLVLGTGFYGRSFSLSNSSLTGLHSPTRGKGTKGAISGEDGILMYLEICKHLKNDSWTRAWDKVGKVPYAFKSDQWVGYDDLESLQEKVNYVKDEGLGGVMVWAVDQDDYKNVCGNGINSLMNFLYDKTKDYTVPGQVSPDASNPATTPASD